MTAKETANKRMALSHKMANIRAEHAYSQEALEQSAIEAKKLAKRRAEHTDEDGDVWVCFGVSRCHPVWAKKSELIVHHLQ